MRSLFAALLLILSGPLPIGAVSASEPDLQGASESGHRTAYKAALALYREGDFVAAAEAARALQSAEGFSLAARAALVEALYRAPADRRLQLLERAAAEAQAALALDPDHLDALLQHAVALGAIAEDLDPLRAHTGGYGERGKALLDRARTLAPASPWGLGLTGIWHLRIVTRGGADLARTVYGADADRGGRLCARARERGPNQLAIRLGCAAALLDLDPTRHQKTAVAEFRAIREHPPADAADRLIQAEAGARLAALQAN